MIWRLSIQLMLLVYACMTLALIQVSPCMAQENVSGLGIFDATADYGIKPFSERIGQYKVPGRVEISGSGEDDIYDLYGNGDISSAERMEYFSLYREERDSFSLGGGVEIIESGGTDNLPLAGIFLESEDEPTSRYALLLVQRNDLQKTEILSFSITNNTVDYKLIYSFPDIKKKAYIRITRYRSLGICHSEWSLDGISWIHAHDLPLEMSEKVKYGIVVTNGVDNELLAHARFCDIEFARSRPIVKRYISPEKNSSNFNVFLDVINPHDSIIPQTLIEQFPLYCSANNISHNGISEDNKITWSMMFPKGTTTLRYSAKPTSVKIINEIKFSGNIQTKPILGETSLPQYRTFLDTLYWMLFMGVPVILFMIHICIFIFYPKSTEYLYFSLFVLSTAISHFSRYTPFHYLYSSTLGFFGIFQWGMTIFFFHTLVLTRLSLYSWILCVLFAISNGMIYLNYINYTPSHYCLDYINKLFWLEIIRIIILAYWKKLDGKVFFSIGLLGWYFLNQTYFCFLFNATYWTNVQGGFANLFFLISMTLYLTYRFAKTQKRYAALNTELEDRVERRTVALENANNELSTMNVELQEANAQLIQLDQMKTQFVSQASHDLRTPLTAIKGSLDNLLMGIAGALNEKQKKVMTRATTSVDRLANLINDVLDLNRIETGRVILEKSDIPFKTLVENIINENHPAAELKHISLNADLGDEINLHIDGGKIERVVGELISNAIKYTPDGGVVDVCLDSEGDKVSLSVKDSGIGMTAEECSKIWERFYRTSASQKFAKGSGLGLSIAKELVELHGGTLTVKSTQGEGAKFTLVIPQCID